MLYIYENRKNMIVKVLSSVVVCIIENYVCADYLCCLQTKPHVTNELFENKTWKDISRVCIT